MNETKVNGEERLPFRTSATALGSSNSVQKMRDKD